DQYFFNIAGIGLDAQVAALFNDPSRKQRGIFPYVYLSLREVLRFKPIDVEIGMERQNFQMKALVVAVANCKQYGAGARIAPLAKVDDGYLHVTAINPVNLFKLALNVPRLFNGTLHQVPEVLTLKTKSLILKTEKPIIYHLDGDTFKPAKVFNFTTLPGALKILVPQNSKI
ncbi:MAG: hypothetical protein AABZ44_06055, partial [Elusimicrobiota bacterium]